MRRLLAVLFLIAIGPAHGAPKDKASATAETPEMANYRAQIDKAFLESGINISVYVATKGEAGPLSRFNVPYPALTFFGYLSRPTTNAIAAKILNSFAEARSLGFKTVVFQDKTAGGEGRYIFDLRKPGPTCSRDLCF